MAFAEPDRPEFDDKTGGSVPKGLLIWLFAGMTGFLVLIACQFEGVSQKQGEEIGLLIDSGKYEEAVDDLKSIEEFATSVEMTWVFNELGFAYNQLERYEEAVASLTKGLGINGSSAKLYANRAIGNDRIGRAAEAEADFSDAIRL